MRTLAKNKQCMYYANQIGKVPKYERNKDGSIKYITVDGEQVPVETGDTEMGYSTPQEFKGNISFSGTETRAVEFGIDVSGYDATLTVDKNSLDLSETSIIWFMSDVEYYDIDKSIPNPKSADYRVKKDTPSLNESKYLLERIVK